MKLELNQFWLCESGKVMELTYYSMGSKWPYRGRYIGSKNQAFEGLYTKSGKVYPQDDDTVSEIKPDSYLIKLVTPEENPEYFL